MRQLIDNTLKGNESINDFGKSSMLGLPSMKKLSSGTRQDFDFNRLNELGVKFGRCAEKILTLALYQAKAFIKRKDGLHSHAFPILIALSSTKIESVVRCSHIYLQIGYLNAVISSFLLFLSGNWLHVQERWIFDG